MCKHTGKMKFEGCYFNETQYNKNSMDEVQFGH